MNIIYLHGLDSSPIAAKAITTTDYANRLGIEVICPNLNAPPDEVVAKIQTLITPSSVLVGSSLGGYFANLVSDMTATPCVLLNPSIRPDLSFRRFLTDSFLKNSCLQDSSDKQPLDDNRIIYTTKGGWQILYKDLAWFECHRLIVANPNHIKVLLQLGDELLDAYATQAFYHAQGVEVQAHQGGDHSISDYDKHVKTVVDWAVQLAH